jgi:hypothetical protein
MIRIRFHGSMPVANLRLAEGILSVWLSQTPLCRYSTVF